MAILKTFVVETPLERTSLILIYYPLTYWRHKLCGRHPYVRSLGGPCWISRNVCSRNRQTITSCMQIDCLHTTRSMQRYFGCNMYMWGRVPKSLKVDKNEQCTCVSMDFAQFLFHNVRTFLIGCFRNLAGNFIVQI